MKGKQNKINPDQEEYISDGKRKINLGGLWVVADPIPHSPN